MTTGRRAPKSSVSRVFAAFRENPCNDDGVDQGSSIIPADVSLPPRPPKTFRYILSLAAVVLNLSIFHFASPDRERSRCIGRPPTA